MAWVWTANIRRLNRLPSQSVRVDKTSFLASLYHKTCILWDRNFIEGCFMRYLHLSQALALNSCLPFVYNLQGSSPRLQHLAEMARVKASVGIFLPRRVLDFSLFGSWDFLFLLSSEVHFYRFQNILHPVFQLFWMGKLFWLSNPLYCWKQKWSSWFIFSKS